MKKLSKRKNAILDAIWLETTNGLGKDRRYVAKSYIGGTGWGVYDKTKELFLSDDLHELNENNFRELIAEA